MGVLNQASLKITPTNLRNRNFYLGHWGAPYLWKTKNVRIYEFAGTFDEDGWESWYIVYFPKKFEGTATPGLTYAVDMRGRFMMLKNSSVHGDHFVSPVLDTMDELDIFIEQVLAENYPEAHEMIKNGDLKYM